MANTPFYAKDLNVSDVFTVNTTQAGFGANVILTLGKLTIGNSTVNLAVNSTVFAFGIGLSVNPGLVFDANSILWIDGHLNATGNISGNVGFLTTLRAGNATAASIANSHGLYGREGVFTSNGAANGDWYQLRMHTAAATQRCGIAWHSVGDVIWEITKETNNTMFLWSALGNKTVWHISSNADAYYIFPQQVNVVFTDTKMSVGNSTVNSSLNATSLAFNGVPFTGGSSNVQTFSANGTWNKPASGTLVYVECWGAGGSGGKNSGGGGGGGAGGAYWFAILPMSILPSTVAVTVGIGGAALTANGNGNPGSNSSFGSYLVVLGGSGGFSSSGSNNLGGDGVGALPTGFAYNPDGIPPQYSLIGGFYGGWGNIVSSSTTTYGGAPGGTGNEGGTVGTAGANSHFGSAGGGGSAENAAFGVGGTSVLSGNGGAGANTTSVNAVDGFYPGGGGGGSRTGNSGAGANGQVRVTVL